MLVQATSHNVRAYSLRDAEDFNETSVDYEHFAACASLPSSSLVKERGDFRLRPVMKQSSTREGRAYTAAQHRGQSLSLKAPSASPLPEPPAFQRRTVSTVLSKPCQPLFFGKFQKLAAPSPHRRQPTRRSSAERGFYRAQSTASTTFFSLISTTSAASFKPIRLAAEGGFYCRYPTVSTTFFPASFPASEHRLRCSEGRVLQGLGKGVNRHVQNMTRIANLHFRRGCSLLHIARERTCLAICSGGRHKLRPTEISCPP